MKLPSRKEMNRKRLEEIAEVCGDHVLTAMFWDMFDDLTATKQETYLSVARDICERETGINPYKVK